MKICSIESTIGLCTGVVSRCDNNVCRSSYTSTVNNMAGRKHFVWGDKHAGTLPKRTTERVSYLNDSAIRVCRSSVAHVSPRGAKHRISYGIASIVAVTGSVAKPAVARLDGSERGSGRTASNCRSPTHKPHPASGSGKL